MRYAILDQNSETVLRVVSENSGAYVETPPARRVLLADEEWCQPRAAYDASAVPRFRDVGPKRWTSYEFLSRFTDAELMSVRAKSQTDATTWMFLTFATAAQEVVSDDPMTVAGMNYLVAVGILTASRKAEILGG